MPRSRKVTHPDSQCFYDWLAELDARGRLRQTTRASYGTDVARFLRDVPKRLSAIESADLQVYLASLPPRTKGRMLSALSEFFEYARQQRIIDYDPSRSLKYHRPTSDLQLDFFELLANEGLSSLAIRDLEWADFIAPLVDKHIRGVRVGKGTVTLKASIWRLLERRFKVLLNKDDLARVLRRRIANVR